jgi:hypothetical protein
MALKGLALWNANFSGRAENAGATCNSGGFPRIFYFPLTLNFSLENTYKSIV